MDICVVGAGIGGLALAQGLVADGHQVRVLERRDGPTTAGAAVTIFSNGAAAAAGLGVVLDGLGGDITALTMRRSNGRALMRTDLGPVRRITGFMIRTVPRAELITHLGNGLADVVSYRSSVQSVRSDDAGVAVTLEGGGELRADVVVGADGYRSAVRASTLADGAPQEVGWATWQGLSPRLPQIASGTIGQLIVGPAGLVGLLPAGNELTQWWLDARVQPNPDIGGSIHAALTWLRASFAGYADPVPELLATITTADVGYYPHVLRDPSAPWGRDAITLLGDAAHAFPPSQAQGANQALEDAWLLRRALAKAAPGGAELPAALRRYERVRAQRVQLISRMAASERTNRQPGTLLGLLARTIPPGLAGRGYLRLLRRISSVLRGDEP